MDDQGVAGRKTRSNRRYLYQVAFFQAASAPHMPVVMYQCSQPSIIQIAVRRLPIAKFKDNALLCTCLADLVGTAGGCAGLGANRLCASIGSPKLLPWIPFGNGRLLFLHKDVAGDEQIHRRCRIKSCLVHFMRGIPGLFPV